MHMKPEKKLPAHLTREECRHAKRKGGPTAPNESSKSLSLTTLHLEFLVPPLQAVDLGLLFS